MTNGEKFKEVFKISQIDEGKLYAFAWLPNHEAAEISIDWWNAEYEETTTKNDLVLGCIDRKKLIDWINIWDITPIIKNPLIRHIQGMSSVAPQEPRKGHWTEEFNDLEGEVRFTCSSCGKYQLFGTDFCYHCGSDNREVVEE